MKKRIFFKTNSGFTLIEMVMVVAIVLILLAISTIGISSLIPRTNLITSSQTLLSDLRSAQIKAMSGVSNESGDPSAYGIFLETDRYTLFTGTVYDSETIDNVVVLLEPTLNITDITFSNNSVVFLQNSGEIFGHNPLAASFTFRDTSTGKEEYFTFNKLGIFLPN